MDDYISRQVILKHLENCKGQPPEMCYSFAVISEIERFVKSQLAADVVKVVHAKWINPHWLGSTSAANCSACNFEAQHREYRGVEKFYKYCPGCNAKMDLGESK